MDEVYHSLAVQNRTVDEGFHLRQQLRQRMQRLLAELGEADAEEYLRITERILSITQHMAQER